MTGDRKGVRNLGALPEPDSNGPEIFKEGAIARYPHKYLQAALENKPNVAFGVALIGVKSI